MDIKTKIRLKAEEKTADTMQAYETLALVVSTALGGGKEEVREEDAPASADELEARLAKAFGG